MYRHTQAPIPAVAICLVIRTLLSSMFLWEVTGLGVEGGGRRAMAFTNLEGEQEALDNQ